MRGSCSGVTLDRGLSMFDLRTFFFFLEVEYPQSMSSINNSSPDNSC